MYVSIEEANAKGWKSKSAWKREGYRVKNQSPIATVYRKTAKSRGLSFRNQDYIDPAEHYEEADRVIAETEAEIEFGGNLPAYRLHDDVIQMPFRHQFDNSESFYETILHELVHWSEKEGRVGRKEGHKYAFGELVAEIGACQMMAQLHLPTTNFTNSAAYVQGWLKGLQNDSKFIFAAAAQASKCADYILSFSREAVEELEEAAA